MTSSYFHNEELKEIIESFYTYVKHPYLQKYLEDPPVDHDQATFLYLMLKDKELDITYIRQCIITTILVQAALDTHESVSIKNLVNDSLKKKRQLTVLAGDYYSSLYYYVLSKVNDIALIRVLAQSIKDINESKMNVYQNNHKHFHGSFQDLKVIDSSLLQNIATMLHLPNWRQMVDEFFFFKRLLRERLQYMETGFKGRVAEMLLREKGYSGQGQSEADLLMDFDLQIEASKDKLINFSRDWTSIQTFFHSRMEDLLRENQYNEQCVMEEG
ncbi:heptaprenyl diphosphate synthase [Evansella vedderi]|uniref:Heptaprenyl diphosphate synthase n=1 Tax=Evansella vedderi TaxID=38282 RepID=A0ABU0A477_9BACI|nr:heptaprenyl diphosphate synthase component 1 [Evansella vedderi]MDQ0257483.1 heptaprenyl diphosphate synthase [Evansella vedderi]